MKRFFTLCVMLLAVLSAPKISIAQAPLFKFSAPSLESGTANTTGAVYRFANALSGVDALISIEGMSTGISLQNIDRTADGYSEAFQPEYKISGNTNAYIDFKIQFVVAGGNTSVTAPLVSATGLDIDGSINGATSLKEFNRIDMGNGSYEFNTYSTEITVSQAGTAFTGSNTTGNIYGALVDTAAKEVMYTVTATNVSSLTYRVGANNQMNGNSTRYASLYFKKFLYQHFPLAISNLLSFNGSAADNKVNLNWEIIANKNSKVTLERSYTAAEFSPISDYSIESPNAEIRNFNYTDNNVSGAVVFYRLKSVNEAGKAEYSNILSFHLNKGVTNEMNVYPSVVQSYTTVNVNATERGSALLQVTDFSGRVVKEQQLALNPGTNSVTVNGFERFLKGNYIVSVRTNDALLSKRILIQ
jgi:hypothetical protein